MNPNDKWLIVNTKTKQDIESAPSKDNALKICDGYNRMEVANGRAKVFAVLPRGREQKDNP